MDKAQLIKLNLMKIQKLFLYLIAWALISSCANFPNNLKNIFQPSPQENTEIVDNSEETIQSDESGDYVIPEGTLESADNNYGDFLIPERTLESTPSNLEQQESVDTDAPATQELSQDEQLKLADTYISQVVEHVQKGRFQEALPLSQKALKITTEILGEKDPVTLSIMNYLGFIYQNLGYYSKALPFFEKGYSLSKEVLGEKHPNTLSRLNNLAVIYRYLGRLSEAQPLFETAYHVSKDQLGEQNPSTLNRMNNLAIIYQELGRLSEALPLFETAYRVSKQVLGEKHYLNLTILDNFASSYKDVGRLTEALSLYEKSYHLSKEVFGENQPHTLNTLNNLSLIYKALGRLSEALPLAEKSYHLSKEILGEKHPHTLKRLNHLADIHKRLNHTSKALSLFETTYHLSKQVLGEKHLDTLTRLNDLALIYQQSDDLSQSLSLFKTGYELSKESLGEKHYLTLTYLNNLALTYQDIGNLSEALALFEKSYSLSQEALGEKHPDTLTRLNQLAYADFKQGNIEQAIQHLEKLVKTVETLRSGDLFTKNRQSLFKEWIEGYLLLSNLYIQYYPLSAFDLAEIIKTRRLLETFSTTTGFTATTQQQLQYYKAQIISLNRRLKTRLAEKSRLETEKEQLVKQLAQFEDALKAKYPKYQQISKMEIVSAKEGIQYLPANAVFISYLVYKNKVLAFTLGNGVLTAHDLGEFSSLEKDLKTYHHQLDDRLSRELGKRLLGPLFDKIKEFPHWIISPYGPLNLIPFETLRLEEPLITQYQISYVQSLSMLALLQQHRPAYKRDSLLAMGAPIYKNSSYQGNPSTVDFEIARNLVQNSHDPQRYKRAFWQLDINWKNLPGTEKTFEELEKLFNAPEIYKQADATEAKLQNLNKQGILAKYRYLLFSTDSYLNVPALSSIVLGQVNNPEGIDGYVTLDEWPAYNLKSDLIMLTGSDLGISDVMSLPYAFYVAGNKNTILTLWTISDEIRTQFITEFFSKLKTGVGAVQALTATKREFIQKGGRYSHPAYWAAFVLYGV
ncbi:hypothetical protein PN36_12025 [Candidatus Thiomargarita nelsonii]|uniref:CHAT domain-containing protein n=1 Tax=Candidatus Thiomargarita nelsonii TaxID=1003181 RepID=A0A0A6P6W3_9GAMM|nr:hypothetical protein PN36_12025 [Candidatus Thiomargarita nelsonii]